MKNVKITVLRKGFYPDLIREHLTEPPEECVCDFFREGDQFLYTGARKCQPASAPGRGSISTARCPPCPAVPPIPPGSGGRGSMWCAVPTGCAR